MKFHEYETIYRQLRRLKKLDSSLDEMTWTGDSFGYLEEKENANRDERFLGMTLGTEYGWLAERRPYYLVYPSIHEALTRLTLELDSSLIEMPLRHLCVRFPVGHELLPDTVRCRSVLVAACKSPTGENAITFSGLFGDYENCVVQPATAAISLTKGMTVEHQISKAWTELSETGIAMARIACAVCLLAKDPDLIIPDVLSDDRLAYEETGDQKYVDRAQRRGKIGWTVGANIEVDPHFRRPHFGIRWMKENETSSVLVPRIRPIKGAVVHRHKLTEVPTGYLDDE